MIFLITPQTSIDRISLIDKNSDSFIYMVSSDSITGKRQEFDNDQINYFKNIQKMKLKNPTLIGFGIHNSTTFKTASEYSQGAIIGSAFIKAIQNKKTLKKNIELFISSIKN